MKEICILSLQKQITKLKSAIMEQQMTIDIILDSLKVHDYELFKTVDMALHDTKINDSYFEKAVIKLLDDLEEAKSIIE